MFVTGRSVDVGVERVEVVELTVRGEGKGGGGGGWKR